MYEKLIVLTIKIYHPKFVQLKNSFYICFIKQLNMEILYTRVSTESQTNARQIKIGVTTFSDVCSGSVKFNERTYGSKIIQLAKDNTLKTIYVHSIDRLGRNTLDILETIQFLSSKGVNVISEKEGLQTIVNGKENPISKLMIGILGTLAEFELSRIKERQAEGIAKAKQKGAYVGRAKGSIESKEVFLNKYPKVVRALQNNQSVNSIANDKRFKVSRMTVIKIKSCLESLK